MNSTPYPQPTLFRVLLYTEWVMLGSCSVLAMIEAWQIRSLPVAHIAILLALLVLGLLLPRVKAPIAILYTVIQMGLIMLGTTLGYLHVLPTLYLIVMIRSCFLFDTIGKLIVASLSFLFFSIHQLQYLETILPMRLTHVPDQRIWMHQVAEFLMFGLSLFLITQLVTTLITERRTQAQLAIAHQQLQASAQQIQELSTVQERNRIARDIHDSLGHALTSLNVQLQTSLKLWEHDPAQAQIFLKQAHQLGQVAIQEVRQSVSTLRSDTSIVPRHDLNALIQDFSQRLNLPIATTIELPDPLSEDLHLTLYRLIQEALTNIAKHAQASQVTLTLTSQNNKIYLAIADNGRGFSYDQGNYGPMSVFSILSKSAPTGGYGLQGMQERVSMAHGDFQLTTAPEQGCQIQIVLPMIPPRMPPYDSPALG